MAIRSLILFLLLIEGSFAASCCGGGVGLNEVILGDIRTRVQFLEGRSAWRSRFDDKRQISIKKSPEIKSTALSVAYQSDNWWQAGSSIQFLQMPGQKEKANKFLFKFFL